MISEASQLGIGLLFKKTAEETGDDTKEEEEEEARLKKFRVEILPPLALELCHKSHQSETLN